MTGRNGICLWKILAETDYKDEGRGLRAVPDKNGIKFFRCKMSKILTV